MKTINATFTSNWDGCDSITTSCKINTETGEVTDIEEVDVDDEYEHLLQEYVELVDGTIFYVEPNEHGDYFLCDEDLEFLKNNNQ